MNIMLLLVEAVTEHSEPIAARPTGGMSQLLLIFGFFIVFYLILIVPQSRKAKKENEMRSRIKEGDKVMTSGGILATVLKVKEKTFVLQTGQKNLSEMEVIKNAVSENVSELQEKGAEKKAKLNGK